MSWQASSSIILTQVSFSDKILWWEEILWCTWIIPQKFTEWQKERCNTLTKKGPGLSPSKPQWANASPIIRVLLHNLPNNPCFMAAHKIWQMTNPVQLSLGLICHIKPSKPAFSKQGNSASRCIALLNRWMIQIYWTPWLRYQAVVHPFPHQLIDHTWSIM